MTEAELAEIEERAEAAAPAPWRVGDDQKAYATADRHFLEEYSLEWRPLEPMTHADRDFAVAARSDVPALVAEARVLRKLLRECEWHESNGAETCPACGGERPGPGAVPNGHVSGCALAAAIR